MEKYDPFGCGHGNTTASLTFNLSVVTMQLDKLCLKSLKVIGGHQQEGPSAHTDK